MLIGDDGAGISDAIPMRGDDVNDGRSSDVISMSGDDGRSSDVISMSGDDGESSDVARPFSCGFAAEKQ